MPTYEYECKECGTITEVFQSITDKPRRKLRKSDDPQCDCAAAVIRLIGKGAGIIFKGSGFYHTDYRSDGYKKAAEAEKGKGKSGKESDSKAAKSGETTVTKTDEGKKAVSPSESKKESK